MKEISAGAMNHYFNVWSPGDVLNEYVAGLNTLRYLGPGLWSIYRKGVF